MNLRLEERLGFYQSPILIDNNLNKILCAKAEIVNLQGQVVMAASSVKTMDLSKLQAGVYMVRAMGLSQQIMLK